MLHSLLLLASALAVPRPPAPAAPLPLPPVVEVCSVVAGTCKSYAAAALEPSPTNASGEVAFIDPETGVLTAPTREQAEELSFLLAEKALAEGEPRLTVLPDGRLRIDGLAISHVLTATRVTAPASEPK